MNSNVYENYIRDIIGYEPVTTRTNNVIFGNDITDNDFDAYTNFNFNNNINFNSNLNQELERYYPDLYTNLYPMIQKVCMKTTSPICEEVIDQMVEEVYTNFSADEEEFETASSNSVLNRSSKELETNKSGKESNTKEASWNSKEVTSNGLNRSIKDDNSTGLNRSVKDENLNRSSENTRQFRRPQNRTLRDLIKILLIRELIGRPNRPGNRPPFPPHNRPPHRPPFMGF